LHKFSFESLSNFLGSVQKRPAVVSFLKSEQF
jgi:hypothetical protein